jgi:dethiobiotin synthetase
MVPLSGGLLIADLARELGLPLLVVARPGLGTINHTLLTCFAAQQLGLQVAGVVVNGMPEQPGLAERGAAHQIGSLCGAPVLGVWPRRNEIDEMEMVDELASWLDGQAETAIVLRELGV